MRLINQFIVESRLQFATQLSEQFFEGSTVSKHTRPLVELAEAFCKAVVGFKQIMTVMLHCLLAYLKMYFPIPFEFLLDTGQLFIDLALFSLTMAAAALHR